MWQKLTGTFQAAQPLEEVLLQMLDPGDPRVVIRPLGNDWLCPFTGQRLPAPDWDGSSLTLLESATVVEHLQQELERQKAGEKAQMKSYAELVQITLNWRLCQAPNYRIPAPDGEWLCPYCLQKSGVLLRNWDGSETDKKWFVSQALQHLEQCAACQDDPINGVKETQVVKEAGGDRSKVSKLVATDLRFRLYTADGSWLCPYSGRPVPEINLKQELWGPELQKKIVNYVLSPACPGKYSQYDIERTMEELRAATAAKQAPR